MKAGFDGTHCRAEKELLILGTLEVRGPGGSLVLTAPRQRTALAMFLLEPNRVVSIDRLVSAVWDEEPPMTARAQIRICVSVLRRLLAEIGVPDAIITRPPGYLLRVADGELDAQRFDQLVVRAQAIHAEGNLAEAATAYRAALGLWRGEPLADVDSSLVRGAATRLGERRLAISAEWIDIELRLRRHNEVIGELMALVVRHPLGERLRAQLMVALCQAGRQAEALEVYRDARAAFRRELGLEPGAELRQLELSILRGTHETAPPPADRPVVPRLLPRDLSEFTGRGELLDRLGRDLAAGPGDATTARVTLVTISGKPGVGKTALAVHLAHRLQAEFPDGQLYARLQGADTAPIHPGQILERLLGALGVTGSAVPDEVDDRAQLYRDLLAGRRMLIVLDDAAGEDQVRPLLPDSDTCAVIVTGTPRLTGLPGAEHVNLDVLDHAAAVQLLTTVLGRERVSAEPAEADLLVRLCGGLPLALRIAAARLAARPHWRIATLVGRLQDERRRLDQLVHGGLEVRHSISVAYHSLPAAARRLFRRLGLLTAPDFAAWVAAPLLDVTLAEAEDLLDLLVDVQLLDVDRGGRGDTTRYRFHDLVRVYSRDLLIEEECPTERDAALARTLGGWLFLAGEAHRRAGGADNGLLPGTAARWPLPVHTTCQIHVAPMKWFERERCALLAGIRQAAEANLHETCWELALTSVTLYRAHGLFDDWRETHEIALAATRRAGNARGTAAMLLSLGDLGLYEERFAEAREHLEAAVRTFTSIGDRHGRNLACRGITEVDLAQVDLARVDLARVEPTARLTRYDAPPAIGG
jgi:DNA-binding SARP family transcriptional activator